MRNKILSFAMLLGVIFLCGCSSDEDLSTVVSIRPVKTTYAVRDPGKGIHTFSGVTQTSQETDLSFKVAGTIQTLPIKIGEVLEPGEVIATLDDESFLVNLAQAQADVAKTFANHKSAQAEYKRYKDLYERNVASANQLDQAEANANSTKAAYDAALQAEELAKLNLKYTNLSVDDTCRIADTYIRLNENITSGQPIAKGSCGNTWEVVISVPESLISSFNVEMKSDVIFSSFPDHKYVGTVSEVGVAANGLSSFPVTIVLDEPPSNIRTSMAAEVKIVLSSSVQDSVTFVEAEAVVADYESPYVFVVEPTEELGIGVLKRQMVEIGILTPYGLQIKHGLIDGQEVLLAGHANARDGMKVKTTLNQKSFQD